MPVAQNFIDADHGIMVLDPIARFSRFLERLLAGAGFRHLGDERVLALAVLTTQGLVSRLQALAFLRSLTSAKSYQGGFYVRWGDVNGYQRYRLSPLTTSAWSRCKSLETDWNAVLASIDARLPRWYEFSRAVPPGRRIDALLEDARTWLMHHLPEPLIEHTLGTIRMTPLTDLAWARRSPDYVPDAVVTEGLEANDYSVGVALSAGQALTGSWFVEKVMTSGFGLSDDQPPRENMRRLAESLMRHADDLQQVGYAEAIWFGWLLHIATFGSLRREFPAASTLRSYLSSAPGIYHALRLFNQHPAYCESDDLQNFFLRTLAGESAGTISHAALVSFHGYLVREFGVKPAYAAFAAHGKPASADANIIWPHEQARLPEIVRGLTGDRRLLELLQVWHAILSETTLRIGELAGLRMRNVKEFDSQILLEIAQPLWGGRLKTPAARRQNGICSVDSVEKLRRWLARREAEGSEADDLLFWRSDVGQVSSEFTRAYQIYTLGLRLSTGDQDVHIHHTRHTAATLAAEPLLGNVGPPASVSPVAELCARMGHADASTLFLNYVHLFEDALQARIDGALSTLVPSDGDLSFWIRAFGKSKDEHPADRSFETPWVRLAACCGMLSESTRVATHVATPLADESDSAAWLRTERHKVTDLSLVVRVLSDMNSGQAAERIVLRANLPPMLLEQIITSLENHVARLLGLQQMLIARPAPSGQLGARIKALAAPMKGLGLSFKRLSRPPWQLMALHFQSLSDREKSSLLQACSVTVRSTRIVPLASRGLPHLLNAMREAGFRADQFAVKVNLAKAPESLESIRSSPFNAAIRDFKHIFGARPHIELLAFRRGRPECYVYLLSKPVTIGAPMAAATNDSASLYAFALSAAIYFDLERWRRQ